MTFLSDCVTSTDWCAFSKACSPQNKIRTVVSTMKINNEGILVKAFLFMGESWQAAHVNSRKVIVQKPQGNSLLVDSWNKRLSCVRTNSPCGKSRYHCVHNHFILANIDILNLTFTKQLD